MSAVPLPESRRAPMETVEPPASLEATGLPASLAIDLVLKHLRHGGDTSIAELGARLALPLPLLERLLGFLREERFVEVPRRGSFDADVRYTLSETGRARADEALRRNQYVGPAPVSLHDYVARVERQQFTGSRSAARRIAPERLVTALASLVIAPELIVTLGAALNSQRPLFLYGASGSGKTWLAEHLVEVVDGAIWVPHAIEIDGEIVQVFDSAVHRRIDVAAGGGSLDRSRQPDARWVLCRRPVVRLGGEMTLAMMDLERDSVSRFYKAPPQLKANNGLLVLDDLGRQRGAARQILNRWITPLDRRVDYLSLHTGATFQVPFDVQVIFSSNLAPASLDDPAFVRRLGYKVRLGAMDETSYRRVFRQACERAGVAHDETVADCLVRELHGGTGTPLLPAYPLDLVLKVRDRAVYEGVEPRLTQETLRWAWQLYFAAEDEGPLGEPIASQTMDVQGITGE